MHPVIMGRLIRNKSAVMLLLVLLFGPRFFSDSDKKNNASHKEKESINRTPLLLWLGAPFIFSCLKVFDSSFGAIRVICLRRLLPLDQPRDHALQE